MSEVVNRVAAAIARADPDAVDPYEAAARAAIEALREPTESMLQAQFGQAGPRACWQAMIDAALA